MPGSNITAVVLMTGNARKLSIYHGRPTSISRSDINAQMPQSSSEESTSDNTRAGLLESIDITQQAEDFLHEM